MKEKRNRLQLAPNKVLVASSNKETIKRIIKSKTKKKWQLN